MITGYTHPNDGNPSSFISEFEWTIPDEYNIASATLSHDGLDPTKTALQHVDEHGRSTTINYGELEDAANSFAAWLSQAGVGPGQRIGVCLPTAPEQLLVHLGAYMRGVVVVPLSILLGDLAIERIVDEVGMDALVIDQEKLSKVDRRIFDSVDLIVDIEPSPEGSHPHGGLADILVTDDQVPSKMTSPDDPALILYTSGTSGTPKGVVLPHRYLIGSMSGYHSWFELFSQDSMRSARVWTPTEWAWAGALFDAIFPTLAVGGTVVARLRRTGFAPDRALELVGRQAVTHSFLPPTALRQIRDATNPDAYDLSSLEVVMCGGEHLSPELLDWGQRALRVTINESYGQTEANALVGNCHADFEPKAGSMGRPYPGHDIEVVDEDGTPVPAGEVGELVLDLDDPVVFLEYWNDDQATQEKVSNGWLWTGDAVHRDEDGHFWYEGRMDDLIISSGYRVSPVEIERVLTADPVIADAVVGGVQDSSSSQQIVAYVLLDGDATETELQRRIHDRVSEHLGRHKTPDKIELVDSLPTTRSGKVDRSTLLSDG